MNEPPTLRTISIPARIALSLASLAGIGTAYVAGFVSQLGFSFSGLIDSSFMSSAVQVAALFGFYAFVFFKLQIAIATVAYSAGLDEGSRSEDRKIEYFKRESGENWRSDYIKHTQNGTIVSKFFIIMIVIFVLVSGTFAIFFGFRTFVDMKGFLFFVSSSLSWVISLLALHNISRPGGYGMSRLSFAHISTSFLEATNLTDIIKSPILITLWPVVILLSAYQFGIARYSTLMRSRSACFLLEADWIEGKLMATSNDGYFVFFDNIVADASRDEQSGIGFIKRDQVISIVPSCSLVQNRTVSP